jgi:NADPH2:quinone reductase
MTMHAIRVHEHGGPEVLEFEELPTPDPGPGEVLVRIDVSGVNFLDIRQRTGDFKIAVPFTAGTEGAGVVEDVGPGCHGVEAGQRVVWMLQQGSYATHAILPCDAVVPVPDDIELSMAGAVLLQGLTAHALATSAFALQPGHTCLIHAVAGGVGGLLTQIAKRRGARVVGTVSKPEKVAAALAVGVDDVIVSTEENFADAARRLTDGRGVDVVYDSVGRDTFDGSLRALGPLGYLIVFGQSSGPLPLFDVHRLGDDGGRYLTRAAVLQHVRDRDELLRRSGELFQWIRRGELVVRIQQTYPLAAARDAQAAMVARQTTGKLLLQIS